ncbi:MAG: hypothetical protein KGN31_07925 [Betaproteobacteria bacterium]|nr:hypothetical protein [Betaproteobacteria bacterium]MDE2424121.1 hypothetical protein [Betaproteobacteria bacterium]
MNNTIRVTDAQVGSVVQALASTGLPAVSAYDVGKAFFLKTTRTLSNNPKHLFFSLVEQLQSVKLLTKLPLNNGKHAYLLFGHSSATAQEIACSLDPFAYVSHLSAMEYHGLTDRFPKIVLMSTPPSSDWRKQALEKMHRDLDGRFDEYIANGLPKLTKLNLLKIGKTSIQFHERSQLGAFRNVANSPLRIATIGRVFLDMVREPQLCGGIQHVIDVFLSEAKRHLRYIIDEVEQHGTPIDKVRSGFLLEEVCNLSDPAIEKWVAYAQRGGSRKLDPEGEYFPHFSDRWKLSINVPSLTGRGNDIDE